MSQPAYNAVAYEQGRPDYPRVAIEHLLKELQVGSGATVLDLAAGTGKLTKELVGPVGKVIAVEPEPHMRAELARRLPTVEVLDGHATSIPVPDASIAAVTVAQAFHWFSNAPALSEIARVLIPGGRLGLIWNVRDLSTPVQGAMEEILSSYRTGSPTYRTSGWRQAFDTDSPFGPLHEAQFDLVHTIDQSQLLGLVLSMSYMTRLSEEERQTVARHVAALFADHRSGDSSPTVDVAYRTGVFWAESSLDP